MNQKTFRHTPPYEQKFLFIVPEEFDGKTLIDFYTQRFKYKSHEYWHQLIQSGCVTLNHQPAKADAPLTLNDEIRTIRKDVTEPDVNPHFSVLYEDEDLFIVNKPTPLPVHPSGRYYKNSLTYILSEIYPNQTFHTIHRLDKWTTGVLILAKTKIGAKTLHEQVDKKSIQKTYGALWVGPALGGVHAIDEAIGRVNGAYRGTGDAAQNSKSSLTLFEFKQTHSIETDLHLLKVNPVTGRTNQIRVHAQTLGGYILNDPLYSPHQRPEDENIDFMGLHCRNMTFNRVDQTILKIDAPWPQTFLDRFEKIDF